MGLPSFNVNEMLKCTSALMDIERDWIPKKPLHSIYLRPVSIAMDTKLGLSKVEKMRTWISLSPVGPYFSSGFKPVKLYCMSNFVRAWPGGYGDKKIGGNYAPTMRVMRQGKLNHNCDTALWLLHDRILEMGSLNVFVFWKNEYGEDELITPPLNGTILPGVTRDSII